MKDSFYKMLYLLISGNGKLIDANTSMLYWTTVWHLLEILHHAYTIKFSMEMKVLSSEHERFVSKFQAALLTRWNFTFQTIFLTISLVYDIMEWMEHHQSRFGRRLKYCRDILFSGLVLPVTVFISTFFWTIYWIDRELVFPEIYDQIVPWWFNHCVHTNILIVIAIETLLQARRHPANLKVELWLTIIVGVSYSIVYYSIYFFVHRWLYGVFGVMTWWQICLFQILIWAYMLFAYWIQFPINRIFHKENSEIKQDKTEFGNLKKSPTTNGSLVNYWDSKLRTSFEDNTRL